MTEELTFSESAALKLLRLAASPRKKMSQSSFYGCLDAKGNDYHTLFKQLEAKGKVRLTKTDNDSGMIELV
jgi:hypothetical protein